MRLPWRKQDWDHYDIHRSRWPENITSWTYKRFSHPFMWMVFGNDSDGCTPWVHGKQWNWFRWWLRNRTHNFDHFVIGLCDWEDGRVGDDAYGDRSNIECKFWIGEDSESRWILSGVRKKGWAIWLPFIRIPLPFDFAFWWGWKPTKGHYCTSLKRV